MRALIYEVTIYVKDDDQTDGEAGKEFIKIALDYWFREFQKREGTEKWPEDFLVLHEEGD